MRSEWPHQALVDEIPGRQRGARERDAMAVDGGVDQHAGAINYRAVKSVSIGDTRGFEPGGPRASIVEMQERQLE